MKKAVLVPYDKYILLTKQSVPTDKRPPAELHQLHVEHIDNTKDITGESDYVTEPANASTPTTTTTNDVASTDNKRLACDVILSYLPKNIQRKSCALLGEIEQCANLSWNECGLVIIDGELLRCVSRRLLIEFRLLQAGGWLTVAANLSIIFDMPPEARLGGAMSLLGIDLARLSEEAGHA